MAAINRLLNYVKVAKDRWHPDDGQPIIAVNAGKDCKDNPYVVLRTVTYEHGLLARIIIPRKFHTDLGSIPWLLKVIPGFRPTDPGMRAFLVHDWLYRKQIEDRRIVDAIMYVALKADGMPPTLAFFCWLGVRLFGGSSWKQNRRRLEKEQKQ